MKRLMLASILACASSSCGGNACRTARDCEFGLVCVADRCVPREDSGVDGGPADAGFDAGAPDAGPRDAGGADGGRDAASADGGPDAGVGDAVGYGASLGALSPADYGCRGVSTAPAGGAPTATSFELIDFFNGMPVEGLRVQLFSADEATTDGSCGVGCVSALTDGAGRLPVSAPAGGWVAYHVLAGVGAAGGTPSSYVNVVDHHVPVPATAGTIAGNAITVSTVETIMLLLSATIEPGTVMVTGNVFDCGENPIANAVVRIFDGAGEIPLGLGRTGPRQFYFNGGAFPASTQMVTNVDGLFGAANVPYPASGRLRVELWGSLVGGMARERLGCEEITVYRDGVSIPRMGPLRADGPPGC